AKKQSKAKQETSEKDDDEDDESNEEYVVNKIKAWNIAGDDMHFRVNWKDCDSEEDTWEPFLNLANNQKFGEYVEKQMSWKKTANADPLVNFCTNTNPNLLKEELLHIASANSIDSRKMALFDLVHESFSTK
ncbi:hypothetical protein RFI_12226, partial [Reticulomyxa filosa]